MPTSANINDGGGVMTTVKLPRSLSEQLEIKIKLKPASVRSRRCVIVVEDPQSIIEGVEIQRLTDDQLSDRRSD